MSDLKLQQEIERLEQRLELALGASHNPEDIAEIKRLRAVLAKDRRDIHTQRAAIGELQAELRYKLDQSERIKNLEAEIERLKDKYDKLLLANSETIRKDKAEIERLNDEIINIEALAKERYCAMQTEIERLRHALQRIKVENADIHCEEIARAALEEVDK